MRTSVSDVKELALPLKLDKVLQNRRLQQLAVQLCHTVHLPTPDNGEVAHPDLLGETFFDERHTCEAVAVVGEFLFDCFEEEEVLCMRKS